MEQREPYNVPIDQESTNRWYQVTERFTDLDALNERQREKTMRVTGAPRILSEVRRKNRSELEGMRGDVDYPYDAGFVRETVFYLTYWEPL